MAIKQKPRLAGRGNKTLKHGDKVMHTSHSNTNVPGIHDRFISATLADGSILFREHIFSQELLELAESNEFSETVDQKIYEIDEAIFYFERGSYSLRNKCFDLSRPQI